MAHCAVHMRIVKRRQGLMVCVLVFVLSMLSTGERVNDTVGGIWARTRISPHPQNLSQAPLQILHYLDFPFS